MVKRVTKPDQTTTWQRLWRMIRLVPAKIPAAPIWQRDEPTKLTLMFLNVCCILRLRRRSGYPSYSNTKAITWCALSETPNRMLITSVCYISISNRWNMYAILACTVYRQIIAATARVMFLVTSNMMMAIVTMLNTTNTRLKELYWAAGSMDSQCLPATCLADLSSGRALLLNRRTAVSHFS